MRKMERRRGASLFWNSKHGQIVTLFMRKSLRERAIKRRFAALFQRAEALMVPLRPMVVPKLGRADRPVIAVGIGHGLGRMRLAMWKGGRWLVDRNAVRRIGQGEKPDSYWAYVSREIPTLFSEATLP